MASKFLTLRFSGCGHLITYHLGVSSIFLEEATKAKSKVPKVRAVSGSSAGAIAAVCFSMLPHRLEEFAEEFISERGRGLSILKRMLYEEENSQNSYTSGKNPILSLGKKFVPPSMHIATTLCKNGSHQLHTFSGCINNYSSISSAWTTDKILHTVKASCTIPQSFHPVDMFSKRSISYPDCDGIEIDGRYHVDGGIASPSPRTPRDRLEGSIPVIVSPISRGDPIMTWFSQKEREERISPVDNTQRLLPLSNLICKDNFEVKPSLQNLKALRVASGVGTSQELEEWYNKGVQDARLFIEQWR